MVTIFIYLNKSQRMRCGILLLTIIILIIFSLTYKNGKQTELKNPFSLHGLALLYIYVKIDLKFWKKQKQSAKLLWRCPPQKWE